MCPFCVSTWDCDGPHIEEKDLKNYFERIWYIKEDLALICVETIQNHANDGLSQYDLQKMLYEKIMSRSIN